MVYEFISPDALILFYILGIAAACGFASYAVKQGW